MYICSIYTYQAFFMNFLSLPVTNNIFLIFSLSHNLLIFWVFIIIIIILYYVIIFFSVFRPSDGCWMFHTHWILSGWPHLLPRGLSAHWSMWCYNYGWFSGCLNIQTQAWSKRNLLQNAFARSKRTGPSSSSSFPVKLIFSDSHHLRCFVFPKESSSCSPPSKPEVNHSQQILSPEGSYSSLREVTDAVMSF